MFARDQYCRNGNGCSFFFTFVHFFIKLTILFVILHASLQTSTYRKKVTIQNLKDIEMETFHGDILKSELVSHPPDDTTEHIEIYNSTLSNMIDSHAPAQTKTITIKHQSLWYTEEI